ncbi:MAG: hypothetical protein QM736_26490 [Vicinamibacterales bacterium]
MHELAVEPEAHAHTVVHRLDVDVARLVANRTREQIVEDGDHVVFSRFDPLHGIVKVLEVVDRLHDRVARADGELHRHLERRGEVARELRAGRIGGDHRRHIAVGEHRNRFTTLEIRHGDALQQTDVDHREVGLYVGLVEVIRQREQQLALGDELLRERDLADAAAWVRLLEAQTLGELFGRQQVEQDQQPPELILGAVRFHRLVDALFRREALLDQDATELAVRGGRPLTLECNFELSRGDDAVVHEQFAEGRQATASAVFRARSLGRRFVEEKGRWGQGL